MQQADLLYVTESGLGGRGVFTAAPIAEGAVIEICPVIVLDGEDRMQLDQTELYNYYFLWGEKEDKCAIALGYGSLYNHSFQPNARYLADFAADNLHFVTIKDIEAGEEITVNYNGNPKIQKKLWFQAKRRRQGQR